MSRRFLPLLLVLSLLGGACNVISDATQNYEVKAEFARTYNLFPGSPVRVLGVEVGKVGDLHTDPERGHVLVDLVIDEGVKLPAQAKATIIPQSLLGERYVQIGPPHTGGPVMEAGAVIPVERTTVPAEFDEILESLNQFVGGLDEDEFARFISNLAEVLDGQGEKLGRTIDQTHEAIRVLRDNDDELISLVSRLADLNSTLSTRDRQIAQLLRDWNTVAETIVNEKGDLDRALSGLVRLTSQVAGLFERHRTDLQTDIATLTRVTRTVDRNVDEIARMILYGAELFRHAQRVVERDQHGWLPLVNHSNEKIVELLLDNLADRLEHLCTGLGFPADQCVQLNGAALTNGATFCMTGIAPCPEDTEVVTLADVLHRAVELVPGLENGLGQGGAPFPDAPDAVTDLGSDDAPHTEAAP